MKTVILLLAFLLLTNIGLFAQSGMTIRSGGAVTVNGNLTITPTVFVCGNPMTDSRDGKTYNTVLIGTQCWMAQNLNIGAKIIGTLNQTNNGVIEKYCYNDDDANCAIYGGLYQWDEAMQYVTTEGVQGICPTGWHLPSDAEWTTLTTFLGGDAVAGGKMKEVGTAHWFAPNTGATNSSGFTALPSGYSGDYGYFGDLAGFAYFWSSSQKDGTVAWNQYLNSNSEYVYELYHSKPHGFSVRCLKDLRAPSNN